MKQGKGNRRRMEGERGKEGVDSSREGRDRNRGKGKQKGIKADISRKGVKGWGGGRKELQAGREGRAQRDG